MLNINTFNSSKGILIILISFLCSFTMNGKAISVQNLTCDYKSNPILVSTTSPEFGWQFRSEQSDVQQTAYAIELFSIEKGKEKKIWKA